ncbi:cell adhesion molecule 1-like isoform X2 [Scylla paramamosain]|uniref:cell adhesion molecule 1-like isoform X2 n=1 Tax=Scylla paramamosain TaxID=85552 RepID=UPI0030834447
MRLFFYLTSPERSPLLLLLLSALLGCSGDVEALKLESITVPAHQVTGKPVELDCNYDLEGDPLYSVTWYRGQDEFYRYTPGDRNPVDIFELPGVAVDTSLSDQKKVTLRPVSLLSSGKYRCEVSADAPSFHTESRSAEMLVVDLPDRVPTITGGRSRYHVGDEVHVNCTSLRSRPAASLMWYINDNQAATENLVEYTPMNDSDGLETSRLGLRFVVGPRHFPSGELRLRCTATIAAVYWQSSEESAEGQLQQTGSVLESKGGSSSSRHSWASCLPVFLALTLLLLTNLCSQASLH